MMSAGIPYPLSIIFCSSSAVLGKSTIMTKPSASILYVFSTTLGYSGGGYSTLLSFLPSFLASSKLTTLITLCLFLGCCVLAIQLVFLLSPPLHNQVTMHHRQVLGNQVHSDLLQQPVNLCSPVLNLSWVDCLGWVIYYGTILWILLGFYVQSLILQSLHCFVDSQVFLDG